MEALILLINIPNTYQTSISNFKSWENIYFEFFSILKSFLKIVIHHFLVHFLRNINTNNILHQKNTKLKIK